MPRPITTKIFQFLAPLVYLWHYTLDRCSTTTKKRTDRRRWYNPCAWWWMNDDEWRWMMDGKSRFWTQRRPENQVFGHNEGQKGGLGSPGGPQGTPVDSKGSPRGPNWKHEIIQKWPLPRGPLLCRHMSDLQEIWYVLKKSLRFVERLRGVKIHKWSFTMTKLMICR